MSALREIRRRLVRARDRISLALIRPRERSRLHEEVPYFCQWESPRLAGRILRGEIRAAEDPRWAESGAVSPEEYQFWSWNVCGMACLKMILASRGRHERLAALAKDCIGYGGYVVRGDMVDGLFYRPFVRFVRERFGLEAKCMAALSVEGTVSAMALGRLVMASVSPDIRRPESEPYYRGGHLVLIVGYDLDKKVLYLHNPSGDTPGSQAFAEVTFGQFRKFFDEKGIVI